MAGEDLIFDDYPGGRPYSRAKRLGKVMAIRGLTDVYKFAGREDVEISPRQMSRYLAGEAIPPHHLARLSAALQCPGGLLQEVENGGMEIEEARETLET